MANAPLLQRSFLLRILRIIVIIILLTVIGFFLFDRLITRPLIVSPTQYPTIQAAVDAALPGDTIYVTNGTYAEEVTVNSIKSNISIIAIEKNELANNEIGIQIDNQGISNSIIKNQVRESTVGIVAESEFSFITSNKIYSNGGNGIFWDSLNNNSIDQNKIYKNTLNGIQLVSSIDNVINRNKVFKNGNDGININGDGNEILRNKSNKNGDVGIEINGNNNIITENKAFRNGTLDIQNNGLGNIYEDNRFGTSNIP